MVDHSQQTDNCLAQTKLACGWR